MPQHGGDSFTFHGDITTHGPAAFGNHARVWAGTDDSAWRGELAGRLAEFCTTYERSRPAMDPRQVESIQSALGDVTEVIRSPSARREAVAECVTRLVAVTSAVGGLAAAAERVYQAVSAG